MITQRRRQPAAVILCALVVTGCGAAGDTSDQSQQTPPAQVSVAPVVERLVTEWDEFNGRIEAVERVELRPRVGGYLEAVHFREGGLVNEGDLLFTIDAREF